MSYNAIITHIERIEPIPNADKIVQVFVLGYSIITSVGAKVGDRVILFPGGDGALNKEYASRNNLLKSQGGYVDDKTRRISTLKLRGVKSEGLIMPIASLAYTGIDYENLPDGMEFTDIKVRKHFFFTKKTEICYRYLTDAARRHMKGDGKKKVQQRTSKRGETRYFRKVGDINQLRHIVNRIPAGATLYLTTKLHGTSQRQGNVPDEVKETGFFNKIRSFFTATKVNRENRMMIGTRNVIVSDNSGRASYYGTDDFRRDIASRLSVIDNHVYYYEIVGYVPETGGSIMPSVNTAGSKELKKFGEDGRMVYAYGCNPGECDFYVYRIASVGEDGAYTELSWDEVVNHCNSIGVKAVPTISSMKYDGDSEALLALIDKEVNGTGFEVFPSVLDSRHIEEGVVVRWEHLGETGWAKAKNFIFMGKEQEEKDNQEIVNMEEVS